MFLMNNKKLLLVIDWSGLMYRSLALNALYGNTGKGTDYSNMEEMKSFIYKFAIDVCSILNIFHAAKVIIAADSPHPWRKDIDLGEIGYKGTRKHSETYNWNNIFKCADDLCSFFMDNGISVAKADHAEADDIICMVKEAVFEKYHDYNIVIVSADADLRQLIDYNKLTGQWCCVYNTIARGKTNRRMLYGTQEFLDWLNSADGQADIFFSNIDLAKNQVKEILLKNPVIQPSLEKPIEILMNKIFCGDDGDAVPSFYSWYSNAKQYKITPLKTKKICEAGDIKDIHDLNESANKGFLKHIIETAIKRDIDDIDIKERLMRQRKLVELNSSLFPENIRQYKADIEMVLNENNLLAYPMKAANILAGTEYAGASKRKAVEADIFKDLTKYTNMPDIV